MTQRNVAHTFKHLLGFLLFMLASHAFADFDNKTIVFAQDTMGNDFRKAQVFEVRDALANTPNVSFRYTDAKGRTALLISQIEQLIAEKVDVIILGTNDAEAVVPIVAKAEEQGVNVIILDRGIYGENYTTFINSDNVKIGNLGAEYIGRQLQGKGKVLLFEGIQTADVTQLRTKGFLEGIGQYPGIEVIRRTGNYLRKDAIIEMEKLLASGERVDAIFSESDSMLSGVHMVLPKYDIDAKSIIMVGCDYTSEAKAAIKAGTQSGSVLFPLGGHMAAKVALDILLGKSIEKHISIPVKLVTNENVDQVPPIF